ncbi:MAG: secondary thiamine-phosphate synthase enzyme YjbQ [Elusimicrobiota bacterium]
MIKVINISTDKRSQLIDITEKITQEINRAGVESGICRIFAPHTTAGLTINENADPSVVSDIINYFNERIPWENKSYMHSEGNSAAHIKSSLFGVSLDVIISSSRPKLGTWQGIYFCEFDGPRSRKVWVKISSD